MADVITAFLYADEGDTSTAPMAAAIANHFAKERGLDCVFHSAGIYALEGLDMDPFAVRALKETYNIDMPKRKSVALTPELHRAHGLHRTMDKRLNAFYNDRALRWPSDGCFTIAKPCGKDYKAYVAVAEYLYTNVSNQIDRLVKEGRILAKDGK
ncbi:MAG: hypothetical protein IKT43_00785 [Clostridia bacterium]|nr:hypothetical protein [Clostridia bacterium]